MCRDVTWLLHHGLVNMGSRIFKNLSWGFKGLENPDTPLENRKITSNP
jgi:hypothetical protein